MLQTHKLNNKNQKIKKNVTQISYWKKSFSEEIQSEKSLN